MLVKTFTIWFLSKRFWTFNLSRSKPTKDNPVETSARDGVQRDRAVAIPVDELRFLKKSAVDLPSIGVL
jgi:hypothetical protein